MLALSDWCNWTPEVAGTDLFLADGCRGARLLMQTFADALVRPPWMAIHAWQAGCRDCGFCWLLR